MMEFDTEQAENKKSQKDKKTSFPKELVESVGLYKPVLNKIITIVKYIFVAPLKISQNSQENTYNFFKNKNLAQVFSCEFCEVFKNTFIIEHLWTTASDCHYHRQGHTLRKIP